METNESLNQLLNSEIQNMSNISLSRENETDTDYKSPDLKTKQIVELTLMIFIIISGTVGNICVIRMFGFTKRRHRAGSALVVALAINDFLSSILIPVDALGWIILAMLYLRDEFQPYPFGRGMCYVLTSVIPLFMMASSWLMAAISMERLR